MASGWNILHIVWNIGQVAHKFWIEPIMHWQILELIVIIDNACGKKFMADAMAGYTETERTGKGE